MSSHFEKETADAAQRHDKDSLLLVYAAREYRELSAQNELRPQDVMRILVHYQAYGDAAKVPRARGKEHSGRIRKQIDFREEDEVGRLIAEYADAAARLDKLQTEAAEKFDVLKKLAAKTSRDIGESRQERVEKPARQTCRQTCRAR